MKLNLIFPKHKIMHELRSWAVSLSFGIGVSASYANSTYNNKVYSFGTSFGWSHSILPKIQGTFGPYNTTPSSWSDFIFSN